MSAVRVRAFLGRVLRPRHVTQTVGWHVVRPLLRRWALGRLDRLSPGQVTVLTVNWNSLDFLTVLIDTVRRRSPAGTHILVMDNGSREHVRAQLASTPEVSVVSLPINMGHDLALDLGVLLCRTEYVVALDVDAFPLHDRWLDELLAPLQAGAQVSGARLNREYVHPCCWAMRTARFVSEGHSFRNRYIPRAAGRDASGDVGEEISAREAPRLHFFEVTSQRGPGDVGTVFGDLVYHNFYSTRFRATDDRVLDSVVERPEAERAWEEALERYVA
jgi:glycosyltransferase involved in cell wall biosynthesis